MITVEKLIEIANNYRKESEEDHPYMANSGFIRINRDLKPYGWCLEKGLPNTECVGSYVISLQGEIWQTAGGNDQDGAREWIKIS